MEAISSQTREEFRQEIEEAQGYTDAATPGGTFLDANVNDIQTIHPLLADDADSLGVVGMLYDQLVGGDVRTGGPAPNGLADITVGLDVTVTVDSQSGKDLVTAVKIKNPPGKNDAKPGK